MRRPIDLNDILLLMRVVEQGSFTAASAVTGIAKSTISQRIAALERALGTGLLRRTSRSFSTTDIGESLLPHARVLEEVARHMETLLPNQGGGLRGTLRLSCPVALAQIVLPRLLARFVASHPDVSLRVEATDRSVDPVAGGFDLAIREHVKPLKDSTLIQRVLARVPWIAAASSEWVRTTPLQLDDGELPALVGLATSLDGGASVFKRGGKGGAAERVPRLLVNDMAALRALAVAGAGPVHLPAYLLQEGVRTGELVALPISRDMDWSTISLLSPQKTQSSPLARAFSDFLAAELPRIVQA